MPKASKAGRKAEKTPQLRIFPNILSPSVPEMQRRAIFPK
jgi:hypothetical protein